MLHEPVLSPYLTVVVDLVIQLARNGMLSEVLYADDMKLMSKIIEEF